MNIEIFSQENLELLFPNKIQRDIFINGMNKLVNIICERTVNVPFVNIKCESQE